ncbi:TPA: hypothetical protein L5W20_001973 [Pseudomonas aeruginosa]|uniref:Uncharacterized protein n=4 Tax=Pseudomonas TaxID=286 RepID=A0A0H2Z8K7_PSEAB|nr:conserved hypothetical protein [Pseudomonas aeruginosa UCBPP-PA14]ARH13629.1 hypothetical protein HW04_30685 [Pseudomonas aeruginosa]EKA41980.1 hypothetical protein PACI27_3778 [Pseudomonas aeruginosa CI27]ASM86673.1 hypothetical protein BWR11_20375 [Pseudomonas aeruginosa]AYW67555.1 hypothetical protein EGV94_21075 [Pseudomonas aeruginosa]
MPGCSLGPAEVSLASAIFFSVAFDSCVCEVLPEQLRRSAIRFQVISATSCPGCTFDRVFLRCSNRGRARCSKSRLTADGGGQGPIEQFQEFPFSNARCRWSVLRSPGPLRGYGGSPEAYRGFVMSRVLFLLLAMVLAGLGQPTLAAPLPDELPAALPAAPPVAPLPMGGAPQPQPEAAEPDLPGSDAASADGEATTKDGLKIGNGSLRLRQDDPGPTRESPLRDPRLNPYAPRQP